MENLCSYPVARVEPNIVQYMSTKCAEKGGGVSWFEIQDKPSVLYYNTWVTFTSIYFDLQR